MKFIALIFALLLAATARAGATSAEFPLNDGGYIVAVRITNDTADKTIYAVDISSPGIRPWACPDNWVMTYLDVDLVCYFSTVVGEKPYGSDLGPGQAVDD